MSRPSNTIVPARARSMPAMALISVVLPAPFGPTTHSSSPAPHARATRPTAPAPRRRRPAGRAPQAWAGRPEVGGHHLGPLHHVGGRAFGEQLAVVEDDDAVGQRHHRAHHVLDEDDGRALVADAPDQRHRVVDLARRQAAQHLVEQHQPRPRGERAGQLEELALVQVQVVRARVRPCPRRPVKSSHCIAWLRAGVGSRTRAAEHRRQRHVVEHAQVRRRAAGSGRCGRCRRRAMRCAGTAGELAALEHDRAGGRRVVAADDVDEGRLARAVRPEQAEDLAAPHVDVDAGERAHAAERLVQAAHAQQHVADRAAAGRSAGSVRRGGGTARLAAGRRGRGPPRAAADRRCRRGRMPSGMNRIAAIRIAPIAALPATAWSAAVKA